MSGNAQGIPQRLTMFVDPKTGLVSETWWRFLNSIWQRTGGAPAVSSTDDIINWQNMADVPVATPPDGAAFLAAMMADVPTVAQGGFVDPMGDVMSVPDPALAAWLAMAMADAPVLPQAEAFAWLASLMDEPPRVPENDPALVAMMVS